MLSFPKAFLLTLAVTTLDVLFRIYRQSKLGSLKSLSLFEQSVDLFLSCWRVTAEAQHRTWQHFVECNMQSPNNYLYFPYPCVSLSIAHGVKVVPLRLCGILGKGITFDSLVHTWHSWDHVPLRAVFCSLTAFGWVGCVPIFMCSVGLHVILEFKIMY